MAEARKYCSHIVGSTFYFYGGKQITFPYATADVEEQRELDGVADLSNTSIYKDIGLPPQLVELPEAVELPKAVASERVVELFDKKK